MRSYLILRLAGPMQAWGQPTFEGKRDLPEDFRPEAGY